jgi:hypothetical protein
MVPVMVIVMVMVMVIVIEGKLTAWYSFKVMSALSFPCHSETGI